MRERRVEIPGFEAKIIYHTLKGFEVKTLLIDLGEKRRVLSTLERFKYARFIGNHYDPLELSDYIHKNFKAHMEWLPKALGIKDESSFLFTSVDMDKLEIEKASFLDLNMICVLTAGVKSNAMRIGVDKASSYERNGIFEKLGTINIILLTNARLTEPAMLRAIITITEAKTSILDELDVRSSYNPDIKATGTGTDNIIIAPGYGPPISYTGGHSKAGELIGICVRESLRRAISRS